MNEYLQMISEAGEPPAMIKDAVLRPYVEDCRYLKSVNFEAPAREGEMPSAIGRFSIPGAFYIQDTGHFNAVEFILCFNQLGYMLTAHCLLGGFFPNTEAWKFDRFLENQLPNVLIVNIESSFSRLINGKDFTGRLTIPKMEVKGNHLFYDIKVEYRDEQGGAADGLIRVCLRNAYKKEA